MRTYLIIAACAVALTACSEATPEAANGAGAAKPGAVQGAQAATPSWVKVYPGAVVVENNLKNTQVGGIMGAVRFTTMASPAEVNDFYRKTAAAEGFAPGGPTRGDAYIQASTRHVFTVHAAATPIGTQVFLIVRERG